MLRAFCVPDVSAGRACLPLARRDGQAGNLLFSWSFRKKQISRFARNRSKKAFSAPCQGNPMRGKLVPAPL